MPKAVSPAVGFNDNVRRRNRNFHVQTEDSGIAHPHIITHLFTDGGRIVKSMRQSYVEIVGEENLAKKVRERMKTQHVGMLEALKSGEFDALVWGSRAPGVKTKPAPAIPASAPSSSSGAAAVSSGAISSAVVSSGIVASQPSPVAAPRPEPGITPAVAAPFERAETIAPARLPSPPRRSTPPIARKPQVPPPPRKTMPRLDAAVVPAPAPSRTRKSVPPKIRRSSRPPPRSMSRAAVVNPRDGLVSQTLDEVILRMLSEEQDSKAGS